MPLGVQNQEGTECRVRLCVDQLFQHVVNCVDVCVMFHYLG